MRKIIWYVLLLSAAFLVPVQGSDVGKLLPVELICFIREGDTVHVTTDVGVSGTGATLEAAVADMKKTAPGILYLDTAEYLLFRDLTDREMHYLKDHVKPSIRICIPSAAVDLKAASAYLRVHEPQLHLRDWEGPKCAEILTIEPGGMVLKEN